MRSYLQSHCMAQAMNFVVAIVLTSTQRPSSKPDMGLESGVTSGPCDGYSRQTTMMSLVIRGLEDYCVWDWSYSAECVRMNSACSAIALCCMSPPKGCTIGTTIKAWMRGRLSTIRHIGPQCCSMRSPDGAFIMLNTVSWLNRIIVR